MTIDRRHVALTLSLAALVGCAVTPEPTEEGTGTSAAALSTAITTPPPPPRKVKSCSECSTDYALCMIGCYGNWNCYEACAGAELLCWDHCVPDGGDPWPPPPDGEFENYCLTHPDASICRFTIHTRER